VCNNEELYKKKDFPHWLGLAILTVASLAFLGAHALYWPWLGWSILIGSAIIDGALYLLVGDAVVCYRCSAEYRDVRGAGAWPPFDLGVSERYRQERIRQARLAGQDPRQAH
jgi:hypothetical protein